MKQLIKLILALVLIFNFADIVYAHPGNTDGNSGHYNHSTGEYHYHFVKGIDDRAKYNGLNHLDVIEKATEESRTYENVLSDLKGVVKSLEKSSKDLQIEVTSLNEDKRKLEEELKKKNDIVSALIFIIGAAAVYLIYKKITYKELGVDKSS